MKVVALLMITFSFGQTQSLQGKTTTSSSEIKMENLQIEVVVDSAEEVKSTFTTKTIEELIGETAQGDEFSFKIICKGEKMSNGVKSQVSYKVKGNTEDKKEFLESVKKIRAAAIKYYESKE